MTNPTLEEQRASEVRVEFDVAARMRDGVTLRANVYRPVGAGPWPTLLARLPYDKNLPVNEIGLDAVQAARAGFMVVVQDTRGRFASDGEFEPFAFEGEDGYDSVEWAARLPGSNGRVGMFGESYFGNTQWLAAIEQPPALGAIAPAFTWSEPMDGVFARGGALELGKTLRWSLEQGGDYVARLPVSADERRRRSERLIDEWDALADDGHGGLPVQELSGLTGHGTPVMPSLAALDDPAVAAICRVAGRQRRVTVPTFHTAGWHDLYLQGTLDNYEAMVAAGREAQLVVGPWTHLVFDDPIGDLTFGARASRFGPAVHEHGDLRAWQLAWFRHHLAGGPAAARSAAPVRIFVMGRNLWRDEASWPLARAAEERWFLRPGGGLSTATPGVDEQPSTFTYDPDDPAPTIGGATIMAPAFPSGPIDQARVEARDDVLVFTSEPLREELEVTGRVRVVLHVESSAPATDWVARLCDVHPDGRSFNLCDGIIRVESGAEECGRYEIDLWSTSNVFLRGHRLRVHVTSSSFPRWDRNLNTGNQRESRRQVARQRVYHDADRPTFVELPVVSLGG
jgi:putative CocE/NonD family hydrolase